MKVYKLEIQLYTCSKNTKKKTDKQTNNPTNKIKYEQKQPNFQIYMTKNRDIA